MAAVSAYHTLLDSLRAVYIPRHLYVADAPSRQQTSPIGVETSSRCGEPHLERVWTRRGRSVCIPGHHTLPTVVFHGTGVAEATSVCLSPLVVFVLPRGNFIPLSGKFSPLGGQLI